MEVIPAAALLETRFGVAAAGTLRAPGRVNLIGEHTDYSLLPVLPMAIDRTLQIAYAPGPDGSVAAVSTSQDAGWRRYLEAAVTGMGISSIVHDGAGVGPRSEGSGPGARLAVSGDLPEGGGLSSSSALTVGMIETLNRVWETGLTPREVVDLAIVAERHAGVESGGMDQTVIMFASPGHALRIDFLPPALRPVPVPDGVQFVIGYSGRPAPKAGRARDHYNRSVVACRGAALLLASATGSDAGRPPSLGTVASQIEDDAIAALPVRATAQHVADRLGLDAKVLTLLTAGEHPVDDPLEIRAAAAHVLSEAERVDGAEAALRAGDGAALGALFAASHASLRRFGACTPELDTIVAAAQAAGAHGARLTGAGFGGWAVAVCGPGSVHGVVAAMRAAGGGPAFEVTPAGGLR